MIPALLAQYFEGSHPLDGTQPARVFSLDQCDELDTLQRAIACRAEVVAYAFSDLTDEDLEAIPVGHGLVDLVGLILLAAKQLGGVLDAGLSLTRTAETARVSPLVRRAPPASSVGSRTG